MLIALQALPPDRQELQVLSVERTQEQLVSEPQQQTRPQGSRQQALRLLGQVLRPLALAPLGQQEQMNHLLSR
jgi:hypothetical protein